MAMSPNQKLKAKNPRMWLVVSGDASLNLNEVLSTHKSEAGALKNRPLFGTVREETNEEYFARIGFVH